MKRTKFIAGALVLSMGLLGTGYAYWTDALSLGATVKTGELNVGVSGGEIKSYYSSYDSNQKSALDGEPVTGLTVEQITEEDNINITIGNLRPGTTVEYSADIKNLGSIPALINAVPGADDGTSLTGLAVSAWLDEDIVGGVTVHDAEKGLSETIAMAINKLSANKGRVLASGEEVKISLRILVPDTMTETTLPEDKTCIATVNIGFHQENDASVNPKIEQ